MRNIHDWIKERGRNPNDHVTIGDLVDLSESGAETATADPEAEAKAAKRADLQAQLDALK